MIGRERFFPTAVVLAAQHSQKKHGVPACVTLAQWALESAYGRSLSGKNNPFGIKGHPGTKCKTWEVDRSGKAYVTYAEFKDFPTFEGAFDYHGWMLARPDGYYVRARPYLHSATWERFVRTIAPTYATDRAYADKIVAMVKRWSLDGFNVAGA